MTVRLFAALLLAGTLLVAGCAGTPEKPKLAPTKVELVVTSSEELNPGESGDPLPVIVRLYRLTSPERFQRASFSQLYEQEMRAIGGTLVGVLEFLFFPGQTEVIEREFLDNERYLGVLVAFRDPETARWQAVTPIEPNQTSRFVLHLDRRGARLRPG